RSTNTHEQNHLCSATSIPPNATPSRPSPLNSLLSLLTRPNARTNSPLTVSRSTQIFCHPSGPCSTPRPLSRPDELDTVRVAGSKPPPPYFAGVPSRGFSSSLTCISPFVAPGALTQAAIR